MHRRILQLAIPSIISNITVPLLGLVDVAKKARSQDFADWKFRVLPIEAWGRPEQLEPAQPTERVTMDSVRGCW